MQREIKEAQEAVATAVPSLQRKNVPTNVSNPTAPSDQDFCDEILTCWRWARSLDHRLDVYRLQFEYDVVGALAIDHQALANEISSFRTIVHELAG